MGKKLKKKAAKAAAKAAAIEAAREEGILEPKGGDSLPDPDVFQNDVARNGFCQNDCVHVEPGLSESEREKEGRKQFVQDDASFDESDRDDDRSDVVQDDTAQDESDAAAESPCPASDGASAAASCCTCRHKETERTAALQSDVQKRLNRVIGQLNGVKAMVEDNRYCGDVLIQLAASEAAVHRISEIILQDHMETCVVEQIREGKVEVVDEAMKLIKKFM